MEHTQITRFVFNNAYNAVIWTIFYTPNDKSSSEQFHSDMPTHNGTDRMQVYCDYFHTLSDAQKNAMEDYADLPKKYFSVEVWHLY